MDRQTNKELGRQAHRQTYVCDESNVSVFGFCNLSLQGAKINFVERWMLSICGLLLLLDWNNVDEKLQINGWSVAHVNEKENVPVTVYSIICVLSFYAS
jgi:hypothetical protein